MRRLQAVVLMLGLIVTVPVLAQQTAQHVLNTPDTLKWVEPPTYPGARLAIVHGNPGQEGPFVYRVKMPASYKIAPHFHTAAENVTVLAGTFSVGMGEKAMHPHFAWAGNQETVVQVHGTGPTDITFVNPADDPRKK